MLIIILLAWLIGIALMIIFFRGATKKEKDMEENKLIADSIKRNIKQKLRALEIEFFLFLRIYQILKQRFI